MKRGNYEMKDNQRGFVYAQSTKTGHSWKKRDSRIQDPEPF